MINRGPAISQPIFFNYKSWNVDGQVSTLFSFGSKEQYDRGVNTFSPEGRIYQIEYAIEAIKVSIKNLKEL